MPKRSHASTNSDSDKEPSPFLSKHCFHARIIDPSNWDVQRWLNSVTRSYASGSHSCSVMIPLSSSSKFCQSAFSAPSYPLSRAHLQNWV